MHTKKRVSIVILKPVDNENKPLYQMCSLVQKGV